MSKNDIKENVIDKIRTEPNPGGNTAGKVADAMDAIVDAIPNPLSADGNPDIDYVTEKIWAEKNEEIIESLSTHATSKGIHFDKPAVINQHLDDYKIEGVYRIKGNARGDNGLATYEDAILIVSMIEYSILQIRVTGARYQRRIFDSGTWREWEDVIPEADKYTPGLMSIDHFNTIENMITNFESLVESQADIKNAIVGLSSQIGYGDETWESYVRLVSCKTESENARYENAIAFLWGEKRISKVVGKNETFVMKGDNVIHAAPIDVESNDENVVQMYNNGAPTIRLSKCLAWDHFKSLLISSPKIVSLEGYLTYIGELDVTRCPNINYISLIGNLLKNLDLQYNTELISISMRHSRNLVSLDLSKNPKIIAIGMSSSLKIETLDISGSNVLDSISLDECPLLKLSGIKFPAIFRPAHMAIYNTAFTYQDIIDLVDKYSGNNESPDVELWIDKSRYLELVNTGDEVYFSDKKITLRYLN